MKIFQSVAKIQIWTYCYKFSKIKESVGYQNGHSALNFPCKNTFSHICQLTNIVVSQWLHLRNTWCSCSTETGMNTKYDCIHSQYTISISKPYELLWVTCNHGKCTILYNNL